VGIFGFTHMGDRGNFLSYYGFTGCGISVLSHKVNWKLLLLFFGRHCFLLAVPLLQAMCRSLTTTAILSLSLYDVFVMFYIIIY
jgi:hypothetical protein